MNISIVVAVKNGSTVIRDSLKSWQEQLNQKDEILVVNASSDSTARIVQNEYPRARLINISETALIPELWTAGIMQSTTDLVALTIAPCIPDPNWVEKARTLLTSNYSALGGAIQNHPDSSLTDNAVYLCRYWRYLPPFPISETTDLPGDNCIYKRTALMKYQTFFQSGFWEPEINSRMKADGLQLLLTPDLLVWHKKSFGFFAFLLNRLQHGYHFGRERSARSKIVKRIGYVVASPIILFLLLRRIWNGIRKNRDCKHMMIVTFPVLVCFLIAWVCGEAFGSLAGPLQHENRN